MQEVGAQLKQAEAERDRRRDEVSSHGQRTGDEVPDALLTSFFFVGHHKY
jgi:hypothetical protein